ncbi:MAG: Hsp20/alpha crystallin family protein [Nitrososphaeraceae archaeon]|nr:Hsp20/alpha crystallin family protein [Nitrososphaeraceae archaeon]
MSYSEVPSYSRKKSVREKLEGKNKKQNCKEYQLESLDEIKGISDIDEYKLPIPSNEYIFAKIIRKSEVESNFKERDPFLDVIESQNKATILIELLGITKKDIKINFYGNKLEIFATSYSRKYKGIIKMSFNINEDKITCNYNTSILEIILKK